MRTTPIDPDVPPILPVPDLLSESECSGLVQRADALGFELASIAYPSGVRANLDARDNERVSFEDGALADTIFARLAPHLPAFGGVPALGVGARWRVYRYRPGQRFVTHRDGFVEAPGARTRLTLLVYLDDVAEGGETYFPRLEQTLIPRRGLAALFQHALLHEAKPVQQGVKHVLRNDVLYPS